MRCCLQVVRAEKRRDAQAFWAPHRLTEHRARPRVELQQQPRRIRKNQRVGRVLEERLGPRAFRHPEHELRTLLAKPGERLRHKLRARETEGADHLDHTEHLLAGCDGKAHAGPEPCIECCGPATGGSLLGQVCDHNAVSPAPHGARPTSSLVGFLRASRIGRLPAHGQEGRAVRLPLLGSSPCEVAKPLPATVDEPDLRHGDTQVANDRVHEVRRHQFEVPGCRQQLIGLKLELLATIAQVPLCGVVDEHDAAVDATVSTADETHLYAGPVSHTGE